MRVMVIRGARVKGEPYGMVIDRAAATAYLGAANVFALLRPLPTSDRDKDAEILALRHQLLVLQRQLGPDRVPFTPADRTLPAALPPTGPKPLSELERFSCIRITARLGDSARAVREVVSLPVIPERCKVEQFFGEWDARVEHIACALDVDGLSMSELLQLADSETMALWEGLDLGYTDTLGHPLLREAITEQYARITAGEITVCGGGAAEAIFCSRTSC
jgi:hypothetical protein